ncbi:MAG: hypothetical protein ACE5GM_07260 [bacterium]
MKIKIVFIGLLVLGAGAVSGGCATAQEQAAWEAESKKAMTPGEMRSKMMGAGSGQRRMMRGRMMR